MFEGEISGKNGGERGKVALEGVWGPVVAPGVRGDGLLFGGCWYVNDIFTYLNANKQRRWPNISSASWSWSFVKFIRFIYPYVVETSFPLSKLLGTA